MQSNTVSADKINVVLDYIAEAVKQGGDAVAREAPLIAAEIIKYQIVSGWVWLVVCGVLLLGALITLKCSLPHGLYEGNVVLFVASIIVGVISVGGVAANSHKLLKAYYAPRLVILDFVIGR